MHRPAPTSLARRLWRGVLAGTAFGYVYLTALYVTLPDVRPLAVSPPATTAFIELRAREARANGRPVKRDQRWVP